MGIKFRFNPRSLLKFHEWYEASGRHELPFRKNASPYRVWISEIMSQQTRVETLIPYFHRFMARFPSVNSLAEADESDVLAQWSGLGYYSRARNIWKTAKLIQERGEWPASIVEWQAHPGIGPYAARAILSFSGQGQAAPVDGNITRILSRLSARALLPKEVQSLADQLLHAALKNAVWKHSSQWNAALMDLGALICTPARPRCEECPLRLSCLALRQKRVDEFPSKKEKVDKISRVEQVLRLQLRAPEVDFVLLARGEDVRFRKGLWDFLPLADVESTQKKLRSNFRYKRAVTGEINKEKFAITNHKVLRLSLDHIRWHPKGELPDPVAWLRSQEYWQDRWSGLEFRWVSISDLVLRLCPYGSPLRRWLKSRDQIFELALLEETSHQGLVL